jgi:hypothetical protein
MKLSGGRMYLMPRTRTLSRGLCLIVLVGAALLSVAGGVFLLTQGIADAPTLTAFGVALIAFLALLAFCLRQGMPARSRPVAPPRPSWYAGPSSYTPRSPGYIPPPPPTQALPAPRTTGAPPPQAVTLSQWHPASPVAPDPASLEDTRQLRAVSVADRTSSESARGVSDTQPTTPIRIAPLPDASHSESSVDAGPGAGRPVSLPEMTGANAPAPEPSPSPEAQPRRDDPLTRPTHLPL